MLNINENVAQIPAERRVFLDWRLSLARRLCQIMETNNLTQSELARMVGISEQELDELVHFSTDPPLSLIARIAALSNSDILTWVNTD